MALFSMLNQAEDGESLTPSMYNNEFQNIIDNMDPDGIEDASENTTNMRATVDPYPAGSPSLATSLRGELQRLRYVITQITGNTYWYEDPTVALVNAVTLTGTQTLTNKTLTAPIIADFTNANHDHGDADDGGLITAPSARVTDASNQTCTDGVAAAIEFDTERWDTDTIHDNVTNNTRLTCKTAGKYLVTGHLQFSADAVGKRNLYIRLNGATFLARTGMLSLTADVLDISVSTIYDLAVNDYVELIAVSTGATTSSLKVANHAPEFMMQRIG